MRRQQSTRATTMCRWACCSSLVGLASFFSVADAGWPDPAKDVVPNPMCSPGSVIPAIRIPRDVTELHPSHLKYSLALGDSISAAALAKGGPLEYREISWSGGSGSSTSFTMPYLVNQYNASLDGPAKGWFQAPQLGPCCGKAPWWSGVSAYDDQLNAALSGGLARDWKLEVDHLETLVSGKGFGIEGFGGFPKWSPSKQEHYKSSWKVLTIFLGMNDVLTTADACSDDESKRSAIVTSFQSTMTSLFDHLLANTNGLFGKLYVNLGMLFFTSEMGLQNRKQGWCKVSGSSFLKQEFPCMRSGGDVAAKSRLVDNVTSQMNEVLIKLADAYDQKRPDFGINLFQSAANQQISHEDLRSPLDCFHPTAKAHRILGTALWNSMLEKSKPQPLDDLPSMPHCADAHTKLVTYHQTKGGSHLPLPVPLVAEVLV